MTLTNWRTRCSWAWTHPGDMTAMGRAARELYLQKYTAEKNYEQLMKHLRLELIPN